MGSPLPAACFGDGRDQRLRFPPLPADEIGGFARGVDVEVNQEIEIGVCRRGLFGRLNRLFDVGVKETTASDRSSVPDTRRWRTTDDAHALNPSGDWRAHR